MTDQTTPWIKASASDGSGQCVRMRRHAGHIEVADSKLGDSSPILSFTPDEFAAWLDGANKNEFSHLIED